MIPAGCAGYLRMAGNPFSGIRLWCLQLVIFFLGVHSLQADPPGDFTYTNTASTVTITGYIGPGGVVAIPGLINGLPVTKIQANAFKGKTTLTSISVPDSVSTIGDSAFESCTNLTGVTIGRGLTSLGLWVFDSCPSLLAFTVDVENSTYSSADGVLFDKAQTVLLKFPRQKVGGYFILGSVNFIAGFAFFACSGLTSIVIPPSVTSVGSYAFSDCTGLTSLSITPAGMTSIGTGAFQACTGLTSVVLGQVDGVSPHGLTKWAELLMHED